MEESEVVRFLTPKTYLIGATAVYSEQLLNYLRDTEQEEFFDKAMDHTNLAEALCSFYAKLCYAALVVGKNENITRTRDIPDNIKATIASGHTSIFEHVYLNFVTTDCSRVFTHELVRHRIGTSFSQTSGRYVRAHPLRIVLDPILDPVASLIEHLLEEIEATYKLMENDLLEGVTDFALKKKITSALRRILPNGQVNEIGWGANITALRHIIQMRTSRHAEWEIRTVFADVFRLVREKFPLLFHDAVVTEVDGLPEVTGMKTRPY